MARIITKELALKIVKKLKATLIKTRSKRHDEYVVHEHGQQVAILSIRRSSEKDKGHDYLSRDLHVSSRQAKELGQCPWSREDYIDCLREKEILPPIETEGGPE
jgi:hypothetical protein